MHIQKSKQTRQKQFELDFNFVKYLCSQFVYLRTCKYVLLPRLFFSKKHAQLCNTLFQLFQ